MDFQLIQDGIGHHTQVLGSSAILVRATLYHLLHQQRWLGVQEDLLLAMSTNCTLSLKHRSYRETTRFDCGYT